MKKRMPTMVRGLLGAVLCLGAMTLTGWADSPGQPLRVMPLGDSLTDGYHVPGGYRTLLWNGLAQTGLTCDFVGSMHSGPTTLPDQDDEGHVGFRIDQIAAQVDGWMATYQPEAILLLIGTNDMLQGNDVSHAADRLAQLIDQIRAARPHAHLLVASILPIVSLESWVDQYNAAIPGLVEERARVGSRISFVDMHAAISEDDLEDGIHPTQDGYNKMAVVWEKALYKALLTPAAVDRNTRQRGSAR